MKQIEIDEVILAMLKSQLKIEKARLSSFQIQSDNSTFDIKCATEDVIKEIEEQIKKLQTR